MLLRPIHKVDLVRLLYLHRYGGVYADLDYEAHANIFDHLPTKSDIFIVNCPVIINEVYQNSLMISTVINHAFWYDTALNILRIMLLISEGFDACEKQAKGSCDVLKLFDNPLTHDITLLAYTLQLTGPAVLDKTIAQYNTKQLLLTGLPADKFFKGSICTHHNNNSWVNIPKEISGIIVISIFVLICVIILGTIIGYNLHK